MTIFFTADEHYNNKEIIKYCNRGVNNKNEMNQMLISRHNSVVRNKSDIVYHVGDFTFDEGKGCICEIMKQLNGTHILILGNHDKLNPFEYIDAGFQSVHTSLQVTVGKQKMLLAHDPSIWTVVWPNTTIFICGHIHKLFKSIPDRLAVNVGVDVWDYTPVSLTQIFSLLGLSVE
ncbi:MAG: metallophosphoesterase family protein [Candidatus Thorarchaeota archaeon]